MLSGPENAMPARTAEGAFSVHIHTQGWVLERTPGMCHMRRGGTVLLVQDVGLGKSCFAVLDCIEMAFIGRHRLRNYVLIHLTLAAVRHSSAVRDGELIDAELDQPGMVTLAPVEAEAGRSQAQGANQHLLSV